MLLSGMDRSMPERETLSQTSPAARSEPSAQNLLVQRLNSQLPPGTSPHAALASLPPSQPGLARADNAARGGKAAPRRAPACSSVPGLPPAHAGNPQMGAAPETESTLVPAGLNPTWICPNTLPPISPLPNANSLRHAGIKSSFNNSVVSGGT